MLSVFLRTHPPDNGDYLFCIGGKPMKVDENITVGCKQALKSGIVDGREKKATFHFFLKVS